MQASGEGAVQPKLDLLRTRRVFFAHQSVGANLLEGISTLGRAAPVLVEGAGLEPVAPGTWRHARLGTNGAARGKLAELRERMGAGLGAQVDVVLFKLCYLDVDAQTDVDALHREISDTLAALRRRFPHTRFVPMTVPLTAAQRGLRAKVKRALGALPGGVAENARRHALNQRLRADAGPLFDLARLEAEDALGNHAEVRWGAARVPVLAPGNTRDGGHLDTAARARIGRALLEFVAGLP